MSYESQLRRAVRNAFEGKDLPAPDADGVKAIAVELLAEMYRMMERVDRDLSSYEGRAEWGIVRYRQLAYTLGQTDWETIVVFATGVWKKWDGKDEEIPKDAARVIRRKDLPAGGMRKQDCGIPFRVIRGVLYGTSCAIHEARKKVVG